MVKSADIYVIELEESTATVSQAAEVLGVEPGRIAKTMSFLQGEQPVLILTEGTAKIDNRKYKDTFHVKAVRKSREKTQTKFKKASISPYIQRNTPDIFSESPDLPVNHGEKCGHICK